MEIDFKRRKSVMSRSMKLGHCVCNPKKPCPCDEFKKHNVCECAGEKMPVASGPVKLTQHVRKAGCASKIGQADLLRILGNLPKVEDPNVLVGAGAGDDAGVYKLDDGRCLVQTVDVFTPNVDDAYLFGQIAAANSLSDCYAMGAKPLTALSVMCFPIDTVDGDVMQEMLRGGMDKLREADCALIGGHSVNDEEVKCGFAITGLLEADEVIERNTARAGDTLVLTKPLGTGMISFAAQIGKVSEACLKEVGLSMATLNRDAARLMTLYDVHAATDITGFGLMGHLVEMARNSGVSAEINLSTVPVFAAAADCLKYEVISGAVERNQEYSMAWARVEDDANAENLPLLYDPQTSGGLLVSLPEEKALKFVDELHALGHGATAIIGRVVERSPERDRSEVVVTNTALGNLIGAREGAILIDATPPEKSAPVEARVPATEEQSCCEGSAPAPSDAPLCCGSPPPEPPLSPESTCCGPAAETSSCCAPADTKPLGKATEKMSESPEKFLDFLKEANTPHLIAPKPKKLMAVALSVARACDPCLKIHIKAALDMGISKEEIDEAAWLAISFTGSPAMMFYKGVCEELGI